MATELTRRLLLLPLLLLLLPLFMMLLLFMSMAELSELFKTLNIF